MPTDDPDGAIKIVDNLHLKYMTGSYFSLNLQRYVYSHGYSDGYLDDATLEINDDWRPFWTITYIQPAFTVGGNLVKKLLVVDAETGKIDEYTPDKVPGWVDRVIGQDIATEWAKHYGLWHHTPDFFNNNNAGAAEARRCAPGECPWRASESGRFPCSPNKDNASSSNGLILYDTRAQKGTFFQAEGASGLPSLLRAEGRVREYRQQQPRLACRRHPVVSDPATCRRSWLSMPSSCPTVRPFSPVSASSSGRHHQLGGECTSAIRATRRLEKYYDYLDGVNTARVDADETTVKQTVTGKILRIGQETLIATSVIQYTILMVGDPRVFTLPRSVSPLLVTAHDGDTVTITFEEPKNPSNNKRGVVAFEDVTVNDQMKSTAH